MAFISYQEINSLEEFPMIAGTDWTLTFTCYDDDGITPIDIGGATIKWVLSPYGQTDYNVLEINGTITGTSTFDIEIPASSTENFSGKYIQQIVVDSFFAQRFRPAQGVVLIQPAIPLS